MIGGRLMPEVLLESGVDVRMIFVPEHGLRVDFEAGATVGDHTDAVTGLPVVSLYGKRKGPEPTHTDSLDIIVFDLQDVGVRFYTYLSTLHYVMEACSRASITLLVLDRPNVNDYTVDGPVLDASYKSFVGMHPIPVLHGMTMGELALMIKGEGWSKSASSLNLQVWKMQDYQRGLRLQPPIPPSPNLRDSMALEWYPTLCFLEGCPVSIGRGTVSPFTVMGSPWLSRTDTCFVPISIPGRSAKPLYMNQLCCGISM
ncbi:MAG: exo-beta-N-acetylmuramidase NamZ domain-containing protein, partial [Bacteroidota bacterium]